MKNHIASKLMICALLLSATLTLSAQERTSVRNAADGQPKIQVAILLDASNSMDGLIDQAKSRLWNIVNTLTTLKFEGKEPVIEIALYMYGNDGLSAKENYVRQITPFTTDLDLISEKLFAIRTNGGQEYCGAVIDHAVENLNWSKDKNSMKLVYIAGNEPFNQGTINYIEAIRDAQIKDIFINTIHCGDHETGIRELWKDGADKGKGKYFSINSNEAIQFIATPYDDELIRQNERLNNTYIYYGSYGKAGYTNQSSQDANAQSMSGANYAERTVSKSKGAYRNESWDLVDKHKEDPAYYKKVERNTLPENFSKLTDEQLKSELEKTAEERTVIQKEIAVLSQKRQEYIDKNSNTDVKQDDFGAAVNKSIMEFAQIKGYTSE